MINLSLKNLIRFVVLVLFQVAILNNIQFSGFVNPFLYVLFILLLPFQTPVWIVMVFSFILGFSIDIFTDTLGLHIAATVLLGFLRSYVLNILSPRDGYESGTLPTIRYFGIQWFTRYVTVLVFAHHFILFFLESFSFSGFFSTMFRIIVSTIFTVLLIVLSQYIVYRKK